MHTNAERYKVITPGQTNWRTHGLQARALKPGPIRAAKISHKPIVPIPAKLCMLFRHRGILDVHLGRLCPAHGHVEAAQLGLQGRAFARPSCEAELQHWRDTEHVCPKVLPTCSHKSEFAVEVNPTSEEFITIIIINSRLEALSPREAPPPGELRLHQ
jgi:hypothetical protein